MAVLSYSDETNDNDLGGALATRVQRKWQGGFNDLMKHDQQLHKQTEDYLRRVRGLSKLDSDIEKGH